MSKEKDKAIVSNLSIDGLLNEGLIEISRVLGCIRDDISTNTPARNTILNLRDCMDMLHDLKKREKELIDNMDDDELEALSDSIKEKSRQGDKS